MFRYIVRSRHKPKIGFAKQLRQQQTSGEQVLWRNLRARRFRGLKFRRQVPVGPWIVDFLCVEKMLVLEVDGDSHYLPGAQERDRYREAYLRKKGFRIFRCGNRDAIEATNSVLTRLAEFLGFPVD